MTPLPDPLGLAPEIAKFNSDLAAAFNKLVPIFNTAVTDAGKVVAFADKELPYVAEALAIVGSILVLIPPTSGVGAGMLAAAAAIETVEKYVKTADNQIVAIEEAKAMGATTGLSLPTKAELFNAASSQVQLVTGAPKNSADLLTAIAYAKSAKIDPATFGVPQNT